ncbi:hydrogenase [Algoriphagus hitonicola]|uniref:Hydroxylaminobenzene mutase n=1 Tax=Algoriphagus hitonicola TaxID=435880 RepID=A0A1I2TEZ9_9BACT|nr:hydrogenase [Algoriphagus hitonicola]SFG60901.1 hydroxylaminobenzene mutase [Algoriphagus hitonicola]
MSTSDLSFRQSDRLIFLGILLFLLGLLVGIVIPFLSNPRMGLSSHLEGIMNGIFLVVLGLIWPRINLSKNWITITFWLAIYGTFVNWLGILIAAVFDAGANLTVAAEGKRGSDAAEALVNFCLISLTLAMFCVCLLILIGLWRGRHRPF